MLADCSEALTASVLLASHSRQFDARIQIVPRAAFKMTEAGFDYAVEIDHAPSLSSLWAKLL